MIDALATKRHLVDHLAPIWCALPDEMRGLFVVANRHLVAHAATLGVTATVGNLHHAGPPVLVANHHDYMQTHASRPIAYVEHGAGQQYADWPDHPSYSGGRDRGRVSVFLTLNDTTAAREQAAYPNARVVVVGSPHLDAVASAVQALRAADGPGHSSPPVPGPSVVVAWHWRCRLLPETETAFPHWASAVRTLAQSCRVVGHGHPRIFPELVRHYERMGVEPVPDLARALAGAEVVAVDNSSVLYEAAALGIPVVALNAPWYRRHVHHGLRFWDMIPGPQADTGDPDELARVVEDATRPQWTTVRQEIVDRVYPPWTRGRAARLAADAICERWSR